ncbi:MAG TPA: hypothetical protein VGE52_12855 [Pirellulales bacterium]
MSPFERLLAYCQKNNLPARIDLLPTGSVELVIGSWETQQGNLTPRASFYTYRTTAQLNGKSLDTAVKALELLDADE